MIIWLMNLLCELTPAGLLVAAVGILGLTLL